MMKQICQKAVISQLYANWEKTNTNNLVDILISRHKNGDRRLYAQFLTGTHLTAQATRTEASQGLSRESGH